MKRRKGTEGGGKKQLMVRSAKLSGEDKLDLRVDRKRLKLWKRTDRMTASCYEDFDCVRTITNLDFRCRLDAICLNFCLAVDKAIY